MVTCKDCEHFQIEEGYRHGRCTHPLPFWVETRGYYHIYRSFGEDEVNCPTFEYRNDWE